MSDFDFGMQEAARWLHEEYGRIWAEYAQYDRYLTFDELQNATEKHLERRIKWVAAQLLASEVIHD